MIASSKAKLTGAKICAENISTREPIGVGRFRILGEGGGGKVQNIGGGGGGGGKAGPNSQIPSRHMT